MRQKSTKLALALAVAGAVGAAAVVSTGAQALDMLSFSLDKRVNKTRALAASRADDLKKLAKQKRAYVDLKVVLDGKSANSVLTSEEQDPSRTSVECQPGGYGPLPIYEGLEYYVQTTDSAGNRIAISVYPGSRTVNPDNDVSCVSDGSDTSSAVVRIRGIYKISSQQEGSNVRYDLRPLTRAGLTAKEIDQLP